MIETVPKQSFFKRHWPSCTLAALLVVVAVIMFSSSLFTKSPGNRLLLETVNQARMIYILMIEFEADYGSYPNEKTAAKFADENHIYASELGTKSSNDFFRQFFAVDMIESEEYFHAKVRGGESLMIALWLVRPSQKGSVDSPMSCGRIR